MNSKNNQNPDFFGLTKRNIENIFAIFRKYSTVKFVHIFGSRACGNFRNNSDIDFAIMNEGVSLSEILSIKSDFTESDLPYFVDIIDFNTLKNKDLIEQIKITGKSFYSINDF